MDGRPLPLSPGTDAGSAAARSSAGDLHIWELDFRRDQVHCSEELCALLGIAPAHSPRTIDQLLRLADSNASGALATLVNRLLSGEFCEADVKLRKADGTEFGVRWKGFPIADRSGEIVGAVGFASELGDEPLRAVGSGLRELLLAQAERIANFGTWRYDPRLRFGSISTRLAQMLEISPGSPVSEEAYWERVHPEDRAAVSQITSEAIEQKQPFQYVARYVLPSGGIRHHFVRGIPIVGPDGSVATVIGITLDFSEQTHAEGELHRLSQQLLRARDEERRNVARELHESTGQTLAALKMSLGRVREALPEEDSAAHSLLRSAVDLADDAVREVRTLSYLMHPPLLDEAGLSSALRWYAKGFSERSGITVNVDIPVNFGRHGQELETTVFRIVQEALTNVHRYSGSKTATIRVLMEDGRIKAEIHDEGCGLPVPGATAAGRNLPIGVGIVGMRERVKQLNGSFEMESSPGKGTIVRVLLPVGEWPEQAREMNEGI